MHKESHCRVLVSFLHVLQKLRTLNSRQIKQNQILVVSSHMECISCTQATHQSVIQYHNGDERGSMGSQSLPLASCKSMYDSLMSHLFFLRLSQNQINSPAVRHRQRDIYNKSHIHLCDAFCSDRIFRLRRLRVSTRATWKHVAVDFLPFW